MRFDRCRLEADTSLFFAIFHWDLRTYTLISENLLTLKKYFNYE